MYPKFPRFLFFLGGGGKGKGGRGHNVHNFSMCVCLFNPNRSPSKCDIRLGPAKKAVLQDHLTSKVSGSLADYKEPGM